MIRRAALAFLAATSIATVAYAQSNNSKPQPVPVIDTIPPAVDTPYPGTLTLDIDATDTVRGIYTVHETLPVARSGETVLLYPKWIPGGHTPRNEVDKVVGLHISAGGKAVAWTRDPVDVYAFHIDVPNGAKSGQVDFQYVTSTKGDQGRIMMTPNLLSLEPITTSFYPAGYFVRQIPIRMTVKYPEGWSAASALNAKVAGSTYTYEPTNYEILLDSPIVAGRYYKKWALSPRVNLNVFAARKTGPGLAISATGRRMPARATCCRTNTRIAGTASSAAAPISGPPTTAIRCATACSGCMKARRNSRAMCSKRAPGWCRSRTRSTPMR